MRKKKITPLKKKKKKKKQKKKDLKKKKDREDAEFLKELNALFGE